MANAQLSRNLFYCAPLIKISLRHSRDYAIIYCIEVFRILTNVSMANGGAELTGCGGSTVTGGFKVRLSG